MVLLNKIKNKLRINYRKQKWPGLINAYKQYLPVTKKTPIISLNEGNTPLILSDSKQINWKWNKSFFEI